MEFRQLNKVLTLKIDNEMELALLLDALSKVKLDLVNANARITLPHIESLIAKVKDDNNWKDG